MRRAEIFYKDLFAGILTETDEGEYIFQYDKKYVAKYPNQFLTFSLPVRELEYIENRLFPFFEGLIPAVWLWPPSSTFTPSLIPTAPLYFFYFYL